MAVIHHSRFKINFSFYSELQFLFISLYFSLDFNKRLLEKKFRSREMNFRNKHFSTFCYVLHKSFPSQKISQEQIIYLFSEKLKVEVLRILGFETRTEYFKRDKITFKKLLKSRNFSKEVWKRSTYFWNKSIKKWNIRPLRTLIYVNIYVRLLRTFTYVHIFLYLHLNKYDESSEDYYIKD